MLPRHVLLSSKSNHNICQIIASISDLSTFQVKKTGNFRKNLEIRVIMNKLINDCTIGHGDLILYFSILCEQLQYF